MTGISRIERVAITGSSGYLGRNLVSRFLGRQIQVLGLDINMSASDATDRNNLYQKIELDICSPQLVKTLEQFQPDTVIHSAFVFQPMRNEMEMHRINVDGFENLLQCVAQLCPQRFHVVSSATAYGAQSGGQPENLHPMPESAKLKRSAFQYAADKYEIEVRLAKFVVDEIASKSSGMSVSWSRPCLIAGPTINNYFSRFLFGMPVMVLPGGHDTPLQFVHEDDVAEAITKIVTSNARGAFNIGPEDSSPLSMIAKKSNRRTLKLPFSVCYAIHWLAWQSRFPIHESPPSLLEFARYPWLVDSSRLTNELGFEFQYSSDQTLDIMVDHLCR